MNKLTWLLLCIILSMCTSCTDRPEDPVNHLISQLNGQHCDYIGGWTPERNSSDCEFKGEGFIYKPARWFGSRYYDCQCRGYAATCLGMMGKEATEAVPHLAEYLSSGPSSYENGEGVSWWCLDSVISALGKIGDERAVPALVKYIEEPRRNYLGPDASRRPGNYAGLTSTITAITQFDREATKGAIEPLRLWLSRNDPQFLGIRGEIVKGLHLLGDEKQFEDIDVNLGRLKDIISRPIEHHIEYIKSELEMIEATLWTLEELIKADNKKAFQKRPNLHLILDIFENQVPRWREDNIRWLEEEKRHWKEDFLKTVEGKMEGIRISALRALARMTDPRVLPLLPKEFYANYYKNEWIPIVVNYGDQLDAMIPEFIKIATDIYFEDRPLEEVVSESKYYRARLIIEILGRRNNTKSQDALLKIGENKNLRRLVCKQEGIQNKDPYLCRRELCCIS